jgi:membrane-associated protease RseP (regulator of RpoE activity)
MRTHRLVLAALAAALTIPAAAEAQVGARFARRGMLGFASELIPGRAERVIVDVVKDSPAERAGVVAGDTLVRFNGVRPAGRLPGFEPGDTVVLRLRRDGRERDVRVVATEHTTSFEILPDSIRSAIAIMVDAVRADMDTIRFPRLRIERKLHGDSAIVYFGSDRVFAVPHDFEHTLPLDSIRSMMLHGGREMRYLFHDSARARIWSDTTGLLRRGGRFRIHGDSANFEIFTARPHEWSFPFDSTAVFVRPGEMLRTGFTIGMRAIAGAELAQLNPVLGEYFGTLDGVLVLDAAEGTPAARSGLRGGDVITGANGQPVTTIDSLRRIVERASPRSTIRLDVLRRGARTTVDLNRQ